MLRDTDSQLLGLQRLKGFMLMFQTDVGQELHSGLRGDEDSAWEGGQQEETNVEKGTVGEGGVGESQLDEGGFG